MVNIYLWHLQNNLIVYSNASYIQLLKNKNAESIVLAIRHIFEYLNGVAHTIWFDNDSALFKIENLEHGRIRRIVGDIFNWFKLHYDFNAVFLDIFNILVISVTV